MADNFNVLPDAVPAGLRLQGEAAQGLPPTDKAVRPAPTPEEIASAAPAAPTADDIANSKPPAPPTADEIKASSKHFSADDIARTPASDLMADPEFKPEEWAAQNPNESTDPKVLNQLAEVFRQRRVAPTTLHDVGSGVAGIPGATKRLAIALWDRATNLKNMVLGSDDDARKAVGEMKAGMETAAVGGAGMVHGAVTKMAHDNPLARLAPEGSLAKASLWENMPLDEVKANFLSAVEQHKQAGAVASGEGFWQQKTGFSAADLAKEGIHLDPEKIQSMALTDPATFIAFEGGFKVINAATGAVLGTAASLPGAQKAVDFLSQKAGGIARQVVGQPLRAAGAGLTAAGENVGKAGVLGATMKLVEGEPKQAALMAAGAAAGPTLRKLGAGATDLGKNLVSGAPLNTTARRLVDLGAATGGAVKDIATGAAVGGALGAVTGETPEDVSSNISYGGAFAVPHAFKTGASRVVSGEFLSNSGTPIPRTRSPGYGENPALDKVTADSIAALPPETQNKINFVRELGRKLGARIYAFSDPAQGAQIITDAFSKSGQTVTPEQAAHAAGHNGFTVQLAGPDGNPQTVIFLNTSADAGGHEVGHALEKALPPELNAKMDTATQGEFTPEEWNHLGTEYTQHLLGRDLATGEDWRTALAPTAGGLSPDIYLAREHRAENFDKLLSNRGPEVGTPEDVYRRIVGAVGRGAEAIGMPLAQGTTYLGQPTSLRSMHASDVALKGVLPEPVKPQVVPKGAKPVPGTPEAKLANAAAAAQAAATAPTVTSIKGGRSPKELLGHVAEAIAQGTGIKINYLSAPDEPAAATTSNRETRRAIIETYRTMPPEARALWEKSFFPDKVITTKGGEYQIQGWAPEVFAANAHKMAQTLNRIGPTGVSLSPYPIDSTTGSFTPEGWKQLYTDAQRFVSNQQAGFTGSGEPLVVPKELEAKGIFKPQVKPGAAEPVQQNVADFLNTLFNFKLPETPRMQKGKLPLNIAAQDISEATMPGRVELPVRPRGEYTGEQADAQGITGRTISEVNPLRNDIEHAAQQAGVAMPSMIEAIQKLNLKNIADVTHAPELPEFRGNSMTLTAGFQPKVLPERFANKPVKESATEFITMPADEWHTITHDYKGKYTNGLTGLAYDLGATAKTPADVAALKEAYAQLKTSANAAMDGGHFEQARELISRGQAAREAYEAATGSNIEGTNAGGSVKFIQSHFDPEFKPPVPHVSAEDIAASKEPTPAESPAVAGIKGMLAEQNVKNLTARAYEFGRQVKTPEEVKQLLALRDEYKQKFNARFEAMAKMTPEARLQAFDTPEFRDGMMHGQIINEAIEKATGHDASKMSPGEVAPVPMTKDQLAELSKKSVDARTDNSQDEGMNLQAQPVHNADVAKVSDEYLRGLGKSPKPSEYASMDEPHLKKLADHYEAASHDPSNPEVAASYDALAKETEDQYRAIEKAGYTLEPYTGTGEPYKNSDAMIADVKDNKHLFYLTTKSAGDMSNDDLMMRPSGIEGHPVNDIFRAVHDFFGHAKEGYQFGPRGEYNAWREHSGMYSDEAQPALAAETLAQNAWVNFGPHLRDAAGNVAKQGEPGYVAPSSRPFAPQKNTAIPSELQAQPKLVTREKPKYAEDAGFGNFWVSPSGEFYHVGDHQRWAKENLVYPEGEPKPTKGYEYEEALKSLGWLRLSREREGSHAAVFVDGNRLSEKQRSAMEIWQKENDHVEVVDSHNLLYKPRDGGDLQAQPKTEDKNPTTFWVNPHGKLIPAPEGHFNKGREILPADWKPADDADPMASLYPEMYTRGYLRVVRGTHELFIGGRTPTPAQKRVLEGMSFKHEIPVVHWGQDTDFGFKPPEGQAQPKRKKLNEFWVGPDGKIHDAPDGHYDKGLEFLPKNWKPEDPTDAMASLYPDVYAKGYVRGVNDPDQIYTEGPTPNAAQRRSLEDLSFSINKPVNHRGRKLDIGVDVPLPEDGQFGQAQPNVHPDREKVTEEAVNHYGLTHDLNEAGYLLPDGRMLDLSGKNQGGTAGTRNLEHRTVSMLESMPDGAADSLTRFLHVTGAARIGYNGGPDQGGELYIHTVGTPSPGTLKELGKLFKDYGIETAQVDVDNEAGILQKSKSIYVPTAGKLRGFYNAEGTQAQPKKQNEYKLLKGGPGGFSKAWILPDGKVAQLGGMWHHHWLAEDPQGVAEAKKAKLDVPPFEGVDTDGVREQALNKGFVRINYNPTNGALSVEGRAADWNKRKAQVQKLVESNLGDIDKIRVSLMNADSSAPVETQNANLFDKDTKAEKIAAIPFLNEAPRAARIVATDNPMFTAPGEEAAVLPPAYRGAPEFAAFNSAGGIIGRYKKYIDAQDAAGATGSVKILNTGKGIQAQPSLFPDIKPVLSNAEQGNMTKDELAAHFPESVIPSRRDEPIPSDIVGSPLYKEAGSEPEAVKAFAKRLVEFAKQWEHDPRYQSGLRWYSEFVPQLKEKFGADAPIMAELLAATSPQNAPESNYAYAVDALAGFKSGRFDKLKTKYEEGLQKLEDGTWERWARRNMPDTESPTPAGFLGEWIDKYDLKPRQSNGQLYGISSVPVLQVLARRWLQNTSGPKTQNFVQNLLGTGHGATIDLWADRTMRRIGYSEHRPRWRVLPKNATGVSDADFAFSQKAYAEAARQLKIDPDALQGGLWFAEKVHWNEAGWSRLDLGDYRKEIAKTEALQKGVQQRLRRTIATQKTKAMAPGELDFLGEPGNSKAAVQLQAQPVSVEPRKLR